MNSKFKTFLATTALVAVVIAGKPLGMGVGAYPIGNILDSGVIEDKIDTTIPLGVEDTDYDIMKKVANIFVKNIDITNVEEEEVKEYEGIKINLDGKEDELRDLVINHDRDMYMSASDLADQLFVYLDGSENLLTPANLTKALRIASTEIPALKYEGRLYLSVTFLADELGISLRTEGRTLMVDTTEF